MDAARDAVAVRKTRKTDTRDASISEDRSTGKRAVNAVGKIEKKETKVARDESFITIPCKTGVPDRVAPIYITRIDAQGRVEARWLCFYCRRTFHRRKPCTGHMGLIQDRKHGCPVLHKEEEDKRRKEFK